MFKLLAIRPLEGCASHIRKCLKTGMMYYFCNDYIIEPESHIRRRSKNIKPLKEDFFTVVSESDYSEDNSSERKSPTVSVSAIVGMNGDGKSTLVELMMRLINNCAISYELCASSDSLRRVKDVKAELYYMVDNVVYRMAEEKDQKETRIWKVSELNPFNEKGEELMRWEIDSVEIQKVEDDPKGFFFTIVSNYSHYAYNIYDYEKEWEIHGGEKDDDEKCWLHYIFHKNDGYLTPITLHPNRYKGNIDINIEKDLSKQRLLSLFLNAENPTQKKYSFRRVNGKDANVLKLTEETKSVLQQKAIIEYFKKNENVNRFNFILDDIDRVDRDIQEYLYVDFDHDNTNNAFSLIYNLLPSRFINPINQILKQDGDFSIFANKVIDLLAKSKDIKRIKKGDIWSVLERYERFYIRFEPFIQIDKSIGKAKNNVENGNYKVALIQYNDVVKLSEDRLGKDSIITAWVYNDIAVVNDYLGQYEDALKYYNMAIEIKEFKYGKDHPSIATTYDNIAGTCKALGQLDKALEYCKMSLSIKELKLGKDHPSTATTYNNIAVVFEALGDYDKASEYYEKAKGIKESLLGEFHLDLATIYNNIAGVYRTRTDYENALMYYNKSLSIRKLNLGKEHPLTAIVYNNLGELYMDMSKHNKAWDYFQRAEKISLTKLGEYHDFTATVYSNIARVYIAQNNYDKALEYYQKVLEIKESKLGKEYVEIADLYRNMAWILRAKGDFDIALDYYEKSRSSQLANLKNNKMDEHKDNGEMDKILEFREGIGRIMEGREKLLDTNQNKFLEFVNVTQLGRLDTLYRIMKHNKIDWKIVTKDYSELTLKEKSEQYKIYIIWSIIDTYPQYQIAKEKDSFESIKECGAALEDCIERILNDEQSHNSRELRQIDSFMNEKFSKGGLYQRLGSYDRKTEILLVNLDELNKHYEGKTITLDNLPPPIYKWDIVFNKMDDSNCEIELGSFSSGEKQLLYSIGAIIYHLQNLNHAASQVKYNNVNLILEEIELYYHPEYQRQFFNELLARIKESKLENIQNINIVFVTHSPFILSDIPKCNVLFLKEGVPKDIMQENTFGANIHTLLKNGFFMPNLPIGEFAYGKINALFKTLNTGEFNSDDEEKRKNDLNDIYQQILLVGEPFLRNQLLMLYNAFKGSSVVPMRTNEKGTAS